MKRFHIALAVGDLDSSIADYFTHLGPTPTVVVSKKYAMWRTDTLNFSINQIPGRADYDDNGLEWELFSPQPQNQKIIEMYGEPAQEHC